MNPIPYLHAFAWIAIFGLVLLLAKTFWLPVAIAAGICIAAGFLLVKRR